MGTEAVALDSYCQALAATFQTDALAHGEFNEATGEWITEVPNGS